MAVQRSAICSSCFFFFFFFASFFFLLGLLMGLIESCTFKGKKKVKSLLRVFLLSCEIRESIILDSKKYYLKLLPNPL